MYLLLGGAGNRLQGLAHTGPGLTAAPHPFFNEHGHLQDLGTAMEGWG